MKVHYSLNGEWGDTKTPCGQYVCNTLTTFRKDAVTCKHCLNKLNCNRKDEQ